MAISTWPHWPEQHKPLDQFIQNTPTALREQAIEALATRYGITQKTAASLTVLRTEQGIDDLRQQISQIEAWQDADTLWKLDSAWLHDLLDAIIGAKKIITAESIAMRETLSLQVDVSWIEAPTELIEQAYLSSFLEKKFPDRLKLACNSPQTPIDHLTGACVGIANTMIISIELLISLWKGFLLSPFHWAQMLTGEGEYNANV